jgi:hypothetical protein
MNPLLLAANLIFLGTYFVNDMLRLRLMSVVATACLVAYFATQPDPMMDVVGWNALFLVMNVGQVGRMLWARRPQGGAPALT